jgi:hypothetical protein
MQWTVTSLMYTLFRYREVYQKVAWENSMSVGRLYQYISLNIRKLSLLHWSMTQQTALCLHLAVEVHGRHSMSFCSHLSPHHVCSFNTTILHEICWNSVGVLDWGSTYFQKPIGDFKILGARRVISKFHTENPQTSGTTIQYIVTMAIWRPGFMHPFLKNDHVKCATVHYWVCSTGLLLLFVSSVSFGHWSSDKIVTWCTLWQLDWWQYVFSGMLQELLYL